VKETLYPIVELTALQLGYQRMYVERTSKKGQPLEGRVLEKTFKVPEETFEEDEVKIKDKYSIYPVYWVRVQLSFSF